jgi:hypothetical protein
MPQREAVQDLTQRVVGPLGIGQTAKEARRLVQLALLVQLDGGLDVLVDGPGRDGTVGAPVGGLGPGARAAAGG